ncbi:6-phosphofructokinase [Ectothiorhodospiraceae bacterium WFHF3C12]|nr:6-phosphofructokinase [Ectothiorhodospiraceae bacterium WFHF3C12]
MRTIGVLTSGGDAPGMNAAIRAVVRWADAHHVRTFGIQRGYTGILDRRVELLTSRSVANLIQRAGTYLKTSRCDEFLDPEQRRRAAQILRQWDIEGLVVVGGDGSLTGAKLLAEESGIAVIGVPGTIDNDMGGTEVTIGFDTAVNTALDAIDKIRDTADSHDRCFVVEVMGRRSGQLATTVGLAGGAETILVPEKATDFEAVVDSIDTSITRGKTNSIIVVAEGYGGGTGHDLTEQLNARGYHARACILGHIQRGGMPTAYDRNLGSIMGAAAAAHLTAGETGRMVSLQSGRIGLVDLDEAINGKRMDAVNMLELARTLAT